MNLIDQLTYGANLGRSWAFGVDTQQAGEEFYKQFVTVPEHAPKSPLSSNLLPASAAASAIAALAAPLVGVHRQTAAQLAAAATIAIGMTPENDAILEPLAYIGSAIFAVQVIGWTGSFLYNTAQNLAGRVRNLIG